MYDYITMGDAERLKFAFNNRIKELEKLAQENPDLKEDINRKIDEYKSTLIKYEEIDKNE